MTHRRLPTSSTPGLQASVSSSRATSSLPTDVDTYGILIEETLTLVVTLDHSPFVDFDVQLVNADTGELILDCGLNVVPDVCVVPFVVRWVTSRSMWW